MSKIHGQWDRHRRPLALDAPTLALQPGGAPDEARSALSDYRGLVSDSVAVTGLSA